MKLVNLKILGNKFRSLECDRLYTFNHSFNRDRLSTKIFAGLNGSGKSNFLELLSEIFYFLEVFHFSTMDKERGIGKGFGFEIEYYLPKPKSFLFEVFNDELYRLREKSITDNLALTTMDRSTLENLLNDEIEEKSISEWKTYCSQYLAKDHVHVRIVKNIDAPPIFYLRRQDTENTPTEVKTASHKLLPSKVIAYTSGQNELISNPFYRLKYRSFQELQSKANNLLSDKGHRLFFLDYSANFSVFIANMLLGNDQKLSYLKKVLKLSDLESFRITLNTNPLTKNDSILASLQKLILCSTSWIQKRVDDRDLLILDYAVNEATIQAFKFHFSTSFNLFKTLYELDVLNLHLVEENTRELLANAHKSFNYSDELPKLDPATSVFRIEKIRVNKIINEETNELKTIYYKSLSDGEHQFNEVLGTVLMIEEDGCLFLMDEPDTHFNPLWRAKLVKLLNYSAAIEFTDRMKFVYDEQGRIKFNNGIPLEEIVKWPSQVYQHEIIITTHSPFVISDSEKQDVYKFERKDGTIRYAQPDIKTYGASVGLIIEAIFDRDLSISDFSNEDILMIKGSIKTKEDLQTAKKALSRFGESVEKFDAFSFLMAKEEEFKQNTQ